MRQDAGDCRSADQVRCRGLQDSQAVSSEMTLLRVQSRHNGLEVGGWGSRAWRLRMAGVMGVRRGVRT